MTDKAIREGFAHLKEGRDYDNLYAAAVARAEADWLVGINATWPLPVNTTPSCPAEGFRHPLAMIARREEEIRNFKPEEFYGLVLYANGIQWTWQDGKSGSSRSFNKERMDGLVKK